MEINPTPGKVPTWRILEGWRDEIQYSSPKALDICGIDSLIVDPHNEALLLWASLGIQGATLIHIDDHDDLQHGAAVPLDMRESYVKEVEIAHFICPAVHEGIISEVYHVNPRTRVIEHYSASALSTHEFNGQLFWDRQQGDVPFFRRLEQHGRLHLLPGTKTIVDIDLDGIHNMHHDDGYDCQFYLDNITYTAALLRSLPRPQGITIARSQTPETYVHPALVDRLQQGTVSMLREVYRNKN